jgi:hypothetical protein
VFALLTLVVVNHAGADTITLTGGYVDLRSSGGGPMVFAGPEDFTAVAFVEWSAVESPVLPLDVCKFATPGCVPGTVLSVNAFFNGGDVQGGIATWRGVAYPSLNGLISPNALTATTTGSSITLPPIADTATVSARFSLTGRFAHSDSAGGQAVETLAGSGTVVVSLSRVSLPGFPDFWKVTAVGWDLDAPLPSGWMSADIGAVGLTGSTAFSNGEFDLAGSGADIWGTSDAFQFAFRPFNGDASITARVETEENTSTFAKAGLMFRRSLVASAGHVILDVRPGGQIEFMTRSARDAATTYVAGANATLPVWLRLTRTGNVMTGSFSYDGSAWTDVGTTTLPPKENVFLNMDDGFAGPIVTSHDNAALNQAFVDHVTIGPVSAGAGNLLLSPGFEEYAPPALGGAGWQADTGRQVLAKSETNQPHGGALNGACWSPDALDCGIYQDVKAPASGQYTFTVFANGDAGGFVGANVNGLTVTSTIVDDRGFANYGGAYTLTFAASAGDAIRVWMYKPAVPGWVVIDDADLRVAP